MNKNDISRFDSPPPRTTCSAFWPIITPKVDTAHYISLAERWHGFFTHYTNGRSILCTKLLTGDCYTCGQVRRQWIGYLPVTDVIQPGKRLLALTSNAVRQSQALDSNSDLFGRYLTTNRKPRAPKGALLVEVSPTRCDSVRGQSVDTLRPKVEETLHQLASVFGLEDSAIEKA